VGEVYKSPKENVYRKGKMAGRRVYHHPPLYTSCISPLLFVLILYILLLLLIL
jgi:hypothetical protein